MNRINWIDAIKGLLIIFIMMSHSCGFPLHLNNYFTAGFVSSFFILSGFTFKPIPFRSGVSKKVKTLLIPYFFYGIICVIILSFRQCLVYGIDLHYTITKLMGLAYSRFCLFPPFSYDESNNIFLLGLGIEPLWFLTCMFLSYIWVYVYYDINVRFRIYLMVMYAMLPLALSFLPILLPWSLDTSFAGAFLIIIGFDFRDYFVKKKIVRAKIIINNRILFLFSLSVYLILIYYFGKENMSVGYYGKYVIAGYLSFLIISVIKVYIMAYLFIIIENTFLIKMLALIGRQSLRLMCLHLMVFVVIGLTDRPSGMNALNVYLWSFTGMAITFFIALFFDKLHNLKNNNDIIRYV